MNTETEQDEAPDPELIIALDPPLEYKGGKIDQIKLREPKASEVRQAEGHLAKSVNVQTMRLYGIALVSAVSGVPLPVVEALPISKLNQATNYLQSFIDAGPKTGAS